MEHSDWMSYLLKVHQHELVAALGNFLVVVELIIKKRKRKREGKKRKRRGKRRRKE
jgi:hypothetical protein